MLFTRNVLLLGAALVLGSALGASAADLGNGSLKDAPVMEPMPAASAGWYARVDGGYNWFMTPDFSAGDLGTPDSKMGGAWSVGGGLYLGQAETGSVFVPLAGESVTPKAKDLIANELRVGLRYDLN
jgi:opacity protein-like surface antigen